jgi:Tfp pilus assembly protein PilF
MSSDNGSVLVQLGDVLLSKGQWAEAAEAYQKALSKGGLKREADARLNCGIALRNAKQVDQAKTMLQSVAGDPSAVQMAKLWILMMK